MSSALRFPLLLSLRCLDAGVGVDGSPWTEAVMEVGEMRPESSVRDGVGAREGGSCDVVWGAPNRVLAGSRNPKEG